MEAVGDEPGHGRAAHPEDEQPELKASSCQLTRIGAPSLPDGLTSIGGHAFMGCTSLALTSLPDGLTSIGDYAFANCTSLALTSLPDGLTSIGDNALDSAFWDNLYLLEWPFLALTNLPTASRASATTPSTTVPPSL